MKKKPKPPKKKKQVRFVLRRTYDHIKHELRCAESQISFLNLKIRDLKVCLDPYYQQHNRLSGCMCGFCLHARELAGYVPKPTIEEIEQDRKMAYILWAHEKQKVR